MFRYRTEIVVPADRYVCLQLPPGLSEGRAIVTVVMAEGGAESLDESDAAHGGDPDSDDIEWWDDLDETRPAR